MENDTGFTNHAKDQAIKRFGSCQPLIAAKEALTNGAARMIETKGARWGTNYRFRHEGKLIEFVVDNNCIITIFPVDNRKRIRTDKRKFYGGSKRKGMRLKNV